MERRGCRVPCSASGGYADPVVLEQPAGSALERSYPIMRIMLTVRSNDIRGLGQIDPAMRRATQDLVAWTAWACRSTTPPVPPGAIAARPHPSAPTPGALLCGPPHKYFPGFHAVLYLPQKRRLTWRNDLDFMRTSTRSGSALLAAVARRCARLAARVLRRLRRFVRVPRLPSVVLVGS